MGMTTRATQKRTPPSALRSQKDIARQSPGSRLRSRSTSHDNELYRMGLRKNAEGEWAVVDNLPTAGIAQAMRQIVAVKRELDERFKGEESERERDMREDTVASSMSIDMGDSRAVLEEIRVYMERSMETSAMELDDPEESVVQSIEVKVKVEVKEEDASEDAYGIGELNPDLYRQSLADIPEDGEDRMDLDEGSGQGKEAAPAVYNKMVIPPIDSVHSIPERADDVLAVDMEQVEALAVVYTCTHTGCFKLFPSSAQWQQHEKTSHQRMVLTCLTHSPRIGGGKEVCGFEDHVKDTFVAHLAENHQWCLELEALAAAPFKLFCRWCVRWIEFDGDSDQRWASRFAHVEEHRLENFASQILSDMCRRPFEATNLSFTASSISHMEDSHPTTAISTFDPVNLILRPCTPTQLHHKHPQAPRSHLQNTLHHPSEQPPPIHRHIPSRTRPARYPINRHQHPRSERHTLPSVSPTRSWPSSPCISPWAGSGA